LLTGTQNRFEKSLNHCWTIELEEDTKLSKHPGAYFISSFVYNEQTSLLKDSGSR